MVFFGSARIFLCILAETTADAGIFRTVSGRTGKITIYVQALQTIQMGKKYNKIMNDCMQNPAGNVSI